MLKINKQPAIEKCWLHVFLVNYPAVLGKHTKTEGGPLKGEKIYFHLLWAQMKEMPEKFQFVAHIRGVSWWNTWIGNKRQFFLSGLVQSQHLLYSLLAHTVHKSHVLPRDYLHLFFHSS